ncbi:ephexin-1-like isoform X1 [Gadus chalcogrammus]|uniref:ephexin-1-like isoform X1 n=1 Tax=Gadus chalcogrammus TaxID=1042646 RepID=UPI0024C4AFEF|nr:ephexin-1-like isoform X1 [Gadus chalcogrammus]XP_056467189.1 ephexin-1-like isoform X1 [Gadus chalcogrammus]
MNAFLRGVLGKNSSQEIPTIPIAVNEQTTHDEEEDDEDNTSGFKKDNLRRNSRFYRSMRKKRLPSSESSQTSGSIKAVYEPDAVSRVKSLNVQPRKPQAPITRRNPVQGDGGGGGGGPLRDVAYASNGGHRGNIAHQPLPKIQNIDKHEMEGLSKYTAAACSVQETHGDSKGFLQPGFETAEGDGINPGMVINERSPQAKVESGHSLNIVKNIAFLYQEYRDTSKQQEIDLRRQRDGLTVKAEASGGLSSSTSSPPVGQLQLRNSINPMSLWQNLEIVQNSSLLNELSQKEIVMQEAMFELVSSEASYYKSLEILETTFLHNPVLSNTLSNSDMHFLFSNIKEVVKASESFLIDLENRIEQSILISDVCDIVHQHATEQFHVFNTYVVNQVYQEKTYRRILQENLAFRDAITSLEKLPCLRGLSFTSFLILPFQRIVRLKLLVQNILKKVEENSEREANAIKAHKELEQIVKDCNEGVRKMSRTEELISIEKTLEFKCKSVPIISHSRWLLKKGEVQQMSGPKSTRTIRSRKLYQPVYLFLFNNLLLITKRNSSGDKFQVLDSCTRAMLRTEDQEDQGQQLANIFNLKLLENQEERQVSYMLKTTSMSDKHRWICALTPHRRTRFMSTSAHQPDSPQVQCIQSYTAQEQDELSVEMADVLNILERTDDGWMMGERLHDSERGWFPTRVVEEIQNKEVRAQNRKEVLRIQQNKIDGPPSGVRGAGMRGNRRPPMVSNHSRTEGVQ